MLELKSYRGFIFDDMKINAKFEGKLSNFRSQAEKQRFHFRNEMAELNQNHNSKQLDRPGAV